MSDQEIQKKKRKRKKKPSDPKRNIGAEIMSDVQADIEARDARLNQHRLQEVKKFKPTPTMIICGSLTVIFLLLFIVGHSKRAKYDAKIEETTSATTLKKEENDTATKDAAALTKLVITEKNRLTELDLDISNKGALISSSGINMKSMYSMLPKDSDELFDMRAELQKKLLGLSDLYNLSVTIPRNTSRFISNIGDETIVKVFNAFHRSIVMISSDGKYLCTGIILSDRRILTVLDKILYHDKLEVSTLQLSKRVTQTTQYRPYFFSKHKTIYPEIVRMDIDTNLALLGYQATRSMKHEAHFSTNIKLTDQYIARDNVHQEGTAVVQNYLVSTIVPLPGSDKLFSFKAETNELACGSPLLTRNAFLAGIIVGNTAEGEETTKVVMSTDILKFIEKSGEQPRRNHVSLRHELYVPFVKESFSKHASTLPDDVKTYEPDPSIIDITHNRPASSVLLLNWKDNKVIRLQEHTFETEGEIGLSIKPNSLKTCNSSTNVFVLGSKNTAITRLSLTSNKEAGTYRYNDRKPMGAIYPLSSRICLYFNYKYSRLTAVIFHTDIKHSSVVVKDYPKPVVEFAINNYSAMTLCYNGKDAVFDMYTATSKKLSDFIKYTNIYNTSSESGERQESIMKARETKLFKKPNVFGMAVLPKYIEANNMWAVYSSGIIVGNSFLDQRNLSVKYKLESGVDAYLANDYSPKELDALAFLDNTIALNKTKKFGVTSLAIYDLVKNKIISPLPFIASAAFFTKDETAIVLFNPDDNKLYCIPWVMPKK